ncbi:MULTISPECIES: DUF1292 domain-containing protein [Eubacterium]|jgi:hypothetical protein|uniref:DUF1292 domain-containing protein n=1 Tax=Eubacterium album TaxID=2978477 RepID=A0ABT2LZA7_9FIRM|nr:MULTISPECIES: DUF1292 domain-containing protein [unclassified Eubacterium (in: firmicutes)]MCJ7966785.1 DUF1292 domain-containing protein [Lachnospiraceae bacterium NSJ-171]MEE0293400.1 DUF1292 domain-containing protein [Eubacterium sp.]CDA29892.1 uncharacterized protein BN504_01394 [Eubacterium sp. CAG:156]MCT7398609.1 DUF1292 domain-containing protein [Eubacterium sp. LFL-14]RGG65652.1 DUF1292 domain-containing protein [Eubacterium sp. AF17-7]
MDGKIIFKNEQGENEEFTVLLETKVNNIKYILVEKEDEEIAYIFKDTSDDSSEEAVYEVVLDEDEVGYIGKIFSELLEDVDLV